MREVDGFKLVPTAVQEEPGSRYYRAAVHVTNAATGLDKVHQLSGEGFEAATEERAFSAADAYVKRVVAVNHHGQLWDRPAE